VQLRADQAAAAEEAERTGVLRFPMDPQLRGGRKRNTRKGKGKGKSKRNTKRKNKSKKK
jgi:hypothetical protein